MNKPLSKKVLILGIDGMDPMLTKSLLDQGKLPHIQEYIKRGAQREDLVMLGAVPTITPPMWTTLSTGAYPGTHGITCFWGQDHENLANMVYTLDSSCCKAEQLWNVTAEAGYRTLVWHWPGCSWPPTSDNSNLAVVDGTQPGFVQFGVAKVDDELLMNADIKISNPRFIPSVGHANTGAGCIIEDLDVDDKPAVGGSYQGAGTKGVKQVENVMLSLEDGELAIEIAPFDIAESPIKPAIGWANAPADAKEFVILTNKGLTRRPCLILKNEDGIYDKVELYTSKKSVTPLVEMRVGELTPTILDKMVKEDGTELTVSRSFKLLLLKEDASNLSIYVSRALDVDKDTVFHSKSLYQDIIQNVGYFSTAGSLSSGRNTYYTEQVMLPTWEAYNNWQAACLKHFMDSNQFDVIFSHLHNVDGIGHSIWPHAKHRIKGQNDELLNQQFMIETYEQTDRYLGQFLKYLDQDWTIFILSDHGLICDFEEEPPLLGDAFGVNVGVLRSLGFTEVKKDANGNDLHEIDWEKSKAIATRTCHIWINLKGRNPHGVVDPADKYKVEEELIDALYNYRDPDTGRRIVTLALRNKDAAILGLSGSEVGDVVYWLADGFHRVHGDSLSTQSGYFSTSVSPIFIAAGKGLKSGVTTERVIRQVDVTPTIAHLLGTRMPEQCEGAVIYQIVQE